MIEVPISDRYIEDINNFQCSDEQSVEEFLKEYALKFHENNLAKTRLYFNDEKQLVGYFTLFSDYVTVVKSKRDQHKWTLTSIHGKHMFPAIRLHYLGVDSRFRKKGYGKMLVYFAIDISKQISEEVGCTFLSIEALNSSVEFYEKLEFKLLNKQNKFLTNMIFKLDELE
jgi:GNAT superfamily N-acetyltransferase